MQPAAPCAILYGTLPVRRRIAQGAHITSEDFIHVRTEESGVTVDAHIDRDGIREVQITAMDFRVGWDQGRVLSLAIGLEHGNVVTVAVIDSGGVDVEPHSGLPPNGG